MIAVSKSKRTVCTNTLSYREVLHSDSPLVFHLSTFSNLLRDKSFKSIVDSSRRRHGQFAV